MQRSLRPRDLHSQRRCPLALADHGYFFAGGQLQRKEQGAILCGQAHVEYFIPEDLRQPWPLVFVHGGGGQALDMLWTPDGRPGWLHFFLGHGYAVYAMDRPGHGRAPYHPDALGPMTPATTLEFLRDRFTHPESSDAPWPTAARHTRWPAVPDAEPEEDAALLQFLASAGPMQASFREAHVVAQDAGRDLLQRIGPAVLLTHSAGGPCGWAMADVAAPLVRAIVAVEPLGPPFLERPGMGRFDYGIGAAPLRFDPPMATGATGLGGARLPRLAHVPVAVVSAEASWMAEDNAAIVRFLRDAGVPAEHIRLEHLGVTGNGHMPMLETNSDEVAQVLHAWIARHATTD